MARALGYGGLANTNGARTFSDKEEAVTLAGSLRAGRYMHVRGTRVHRDWLSFFLLPFLFR